MGPQPMNFVENIFERLGQAKSVPVVAELRGAEIISANGGELLLLVWRARAFLRAAGAEKGDRCGLLAPNSIRWIAMDLAMLAEGITVVPLYARQAPAELEQIVQDAAPSMVFCGDAALRDALFAPGTLMPEAPLLDEVFAVPANPGPMDAPSPLEASDPVTIIYTSGTSGEAKGVVLNAGNVGHMLECTGSRLDALMGSKRGPERIFHYLPFSFAASWILLLTALVRDSYLLLSTDLGRLAEEMKTARPHYFLNVPALLERVRKQIEERIAQTGGVAALLFKNARASWLRGQSGGHRRLDAVWLAVGNALVVSKIRAGLGPDLKALICGSAPLAVDTQLFFTMLGIPVLQAYGLTETTAICTLDVPSAVMPGCVGRAVTGVEMRLGEEEEILVRGPNVFLGYWRRPEETARALRDGWFHTGDRGAVDAAGNWRISGRLKSLIILRSGHKIAPDPLEEMLRRELDGAQHIMLAGNDRSFLAAIISGEVTRENAQSAIDNVNHDLPHYKQIHAFLITEEVFTNETGLLTANGKLRREAITARFRDEIEAMYAEIKH
jgi:long-chain acyl-CoA synthetase